VPGAPPTDPRADLRLGVVIAVCGIALLSWPGATIRVVGTLLGIAAVVHGVRELAVVFGGHGERLSLAPGMLALVAVFGGLVVIVAPFVSADAARITLGVFWLVFGVAEAAAGLAGGLDPVRLSIAGSALVVGIIVLAASALALSVLVWLTGAWMVLSGLAVAIGAAAATRSAPA
jgi:hypothetical protein